MQFRNLLDQDEDRAVSPVIGVILMVAITVILAAVIGTFVLGLGDQVQQTAPNAQFSFDYDNNHQSGEHDELEIIHDGGDGISGDELFVRVSGAQDYDDAAADPYSDIDQGDDGGDYFTADTVRAGTSATVTDDSVAGNNWDTLDNDLALNGSTVRVVWEDNDSDRSSTLRNWTGSDA